MVFYTADLPRGEEFVKAINEVIKFPAVRSFLGAVGDSLHNSNDIGP
ncbi:hypothetical protein [Phosphitispora sp. TUW77]